MLRFTLASFVFVLGTTVLLEGCASQPATSVAQLFLLRGVVSDVKNATNEVIGYGDDAAYQRLKQAESGLQSSIDGLDKVIKKGEESLANERENAARQAFEALAQTQKIISEQVRDGFTRVNESLAGAAAIVDAIPFIKVTDTVLAVTPYRLISGTPKAEIAIFGYFPSASIDTNAIKVTIDDQPMTVRRGVGKLYFDLPDAMTNSNEQRLNVKIELPKLGFFGSKPTPIEQRLNLLKRQPFTFEVEYQVKNPNAYASISGNNHVESANNDRNVTLQAPALLSTTVPNAGQLYEINTARFANITVISQSGSKECECCPTPTGRYDGLNSDQTAAYLAFNVTSCNPGTRCGSGLQTYLCGGGGSNYIITIHPEFSVRRKGVPETTPENSEKREAGFASRVEVQATQNWTGIVIKAAYDDGFEQRQDPPVTLSRGVAQGNTPRWNAQVDTVSNKLVITTK